MSNIFDKLGDKKDDSKVKESQQDDDNNDAENKGEHHLTKKERRAQDQSLRETYGDVVDKGATNQRQDNPIKMKDDWESGDKRPHDRHSANTHANAPGPREMKKGGHGKGNVGNLNEIIEGALNNQDNDEFEDPLEEDQGQETQAEGQDRQNKDKAEGDSAQGGNAQNEIITADQYVKSTGIDYAFMHDNKADAHNEAAQANKTDDPNLKAHIPKQKDHPEYHKITKNPDAIFVPSTNIADPNVNKALEENKEGQKQEKSDEKDDSKKTDNNSDQNKDQKDQNKDQQNVDSNNDQKNNQDNAQNNNQNNSQNNNQDNAQASNQDKNQDNQADKINIQANNQQNQNNQTKDQTNIQNNDQQVADKKSDKKEDSESMNMNKDKIDMKNEFSDANVPKIPRIEDTQNSVNDQNKTVGDIITQLDEAKDNKDANKSADQKDSKTESQNKEEAAGETTLNRSFIEESKDQIDTSKNASTEKVIPSNASVITQQDTFTENSIRDPFQGENLPNVPQDPVAPKQPLDLNNVQEQADNLSTKSEPGATETNLQDKDDNVKVQQEADNNDKQENKSTDATKPHEQ